MNRYLGIALSPIMPWYRTDVAVEFDSGYMVITTPEGKWLGSWPATRVTAKQFAGSRLELTLGSEEFPFEFEDQASLLEALEAETDHLWELTPYERLIQKARVFRLRFFGSLNSTDPSIQDAAVDLPSAPDVQDSDSESVALQMELAATQEETVLDDPLHPGLIEAQRETVEALEAGMRWWFGFYFLVGEGSDQTRLQGAAHGLQEASEQLWRTEKDLDGISGMDASLDTLVAPYRVAVDGWAFALDSIARGAVLDQKRIAEEGFTQMANASALAEHVVEYHMKPVRHSILTDPLYSLEQLQPPTKVARKAMDRSKQPWRRAILAAGSPFRRPQ